MPSLRIGRDSGYADRLRSYKIVLDGKVIERIGNGETRDLEVPAGQHQLALRVDWCGSKTLAFSLADGEAISFRVSSNLRGWRVVLGLWYTIVETNSYLLLEQIPSPPLR
jgi:hypothetical protein